MKVTRGHVHCNRGKSPGRLHILGSLSNKDGCFKLYHAYSIAFNSSNVGKLFWSWILKDCIKVQGKKNKVLSCVCTCKVVVLLNEPIAFLPFSLPSPSPLLPSCGRVLLLDPRLKVREVKCIHDKRTARLSKENSIWFSFTCTLPLAFTFLFPFTRNSMPSVLSTAPEIQGQEIESQRASYTKKSLCEEINKQFAWRRHFTTTTRILRGFPLCLLYLIGITTFKCGRKSEMDSGSGS